MIEMTEAELVTLIQARDICTAKGAPPGTTLDDERIYAGAAAIAINTVLQHAITP